MKICYISNLYTPFVMGGAEICAERESMELAKHNEVIVITTKPYTGLKSLKPSVEVKDNVKIYRFYPMNLYYGYYYTKKPKWIKPLWHLIDIWNLHTYFVIKRILEKEKPDVVHTHNLEIISTSVLSVIKHLKIPHVHTIHDYLLLNRANNLLRAGNIIEDFNIADTIYMKIMQNLSSSIDIVLAPSQFVLNIHTQKGYFTNSICVKLPLGVEIEKAHKIDKDYAVIDVLYVGQVSNHKGVRILINAFQQLKYENVLLHIVGKGADVEEFKKIAGSDSRIIFHGFVPDKELMQLYQKSNLLVVPSIWYDNSPTVIYESFMAGTPAIGSRIGGIPELVEEGKNGFLFEAGKVDELKAILDNVMRNTEGLKSLEEGALESVKKYNMEEHIKKLEEIYKDCLRAKL